MDSTDIYVILASARSGKSVMMNNIVRDMLYKSKEKKPRVYLFNNDQVENKIVDPEFCFRYDGDLMEKLAKSPGEKIIIIEDLMSQMSDMKEKKRLEGLLSIHRHCSCHYIIISQTFISLPPSIRMREVSSCVYLVVGKQKRKDRMKLIYEACECWEEFEEYYELNKELIQYEFIKITPDNKFNIVKSDPKKIIYIKSSRKQVK